MNRLTGQLLALALIAALALAAVLGIRSFEASSGPEAGRAASPSSGKSADQAKLAVPLVPIERFTQTTTRPVFFEGRKYPAREKPEVAAEQTAGGPDVPTATAAGVRLLGVQLGGGAQRALIQAQSAPPSWHSVGEKFQTWTIVAIKDDRVLLGQGGQKAELRLYERQ